MQSGSGLLPCVPPPAELVAQTRRHQAEAPYFGLGFRKSKLPAEIHARLLDHLRVNVERFRPEREGYVVRATDDGTIPSIYFGDPAFNARLGEDLRPLHEEWCGMRLEPTYCYGIRVYQRGTLLHNHVDRTATHIISSTICVDHRLDSPWPLYIEDVDDRPHQVDMAPGEFLFYEGARLCHGRPYPLDGDYYAGIFVHYRPLDR